MINEDIRDKEIRLVDEDGSALGIVSTNEARSLAVQKNLDLVKIAPNANPPVCKIMDYGKHVFDLAKKEKEVKKKQKVVNVKEVRIGLDIGDHDFEVRVRNAQKFLKNEDKVKLTVKFVGREMNYTSRGQDLINRFVESVSDYGTIDKRPRQEGKRLSVIINPN